MYSRFREFLALNPGIIDVMIRLARDRIRRTGQRRVGINALIERYRWEIPASTEDPSFPGKINNTWAPWLAREMAAQAPDLVDVFNTRASAADRHYQIVRVPGGGPRLDRGAGAP